MNVAMAIYTLIAAALWGPTLVSMRRTLTSSSHAEHLMGALIIAMGWPVTGPILAWSFVRPEPAATDLTVVDSVAVAATESSPKAA